VKFNNIEKRVRDLFNRNLKKGIDKKGNSYIYICPDIKKYPHQWLWDSCFHIIVNSHLNINLAKEEFKTLLSRQWDNGFLPHMNYWEYNKYSIIDRKIQSYYKEKNTSSLTQTPVVPQALRAIYRIAQDRDYLVEYLPKVKNYYDYLYNSRVFLDDEIPLLNIIHSWESGIDNSPIYDKALGIKGNLLLFKWLKSLIKQLKILKECKWDMQLIKERNFFLYKDLLFNCVYIQGCRDLAELYKEVKNSKESSFYDKRAKNLEKIIIKYCWNQDQGLFFNRFGIENNSDSIKTFTSLIPLILEGLPLNIATTLVEDHLINEKEFWTPFPIPSVAKNEPSYTERGLLLWRGPTWISVNWFLIKALYMHGFNNIAMDLTQKTTDLIESSGFREFYNPHTGEGKGAKNFGWSSLIIDILMSKFNINSDFILNREYMHVKKGPT